jgi:hypothetical protein
MQNLNNKLIGSYGYELEKSFGVINIDKIKDDNINCLKIPSHMDSQFGVYDKKYRKYKEKYLALKNNIFGIIRKIK